MRSCPACLYNTLPQIIGIWDVSLAWLWHGQWRLSYMADTGYAVVMDLCVVRDPNIAEANQPTTIIPFLKFSFLSPP